MKILCLIPPYIPSYFNAGHHLPVFQVSAYLREHLPEDEIIAIDAAALNFSWKEICDTLVKKFDVIALMNDFDGIDTFQRFLKYKSSLSPHTKTITFGRLSKQIPKFFFQFDLDAVHYDGDYEAGVLAYIRFLKGEIKTIPGIYLSKEDNFSKGEILNAEDWVLPNVSEIPYQAYAYMYKNDLNKFCGIPQRQELVVPLARGCPVGCSYCDVPSMQGKIERRLTVDRTINYIVDSFKKLPFEYVSFYAPTFTLNHKWVQELCEKLISLPRRYPWKCVTVLKRLNKELIELMASSGCVRISLGIESFTRTAALGLPKIKQDTIETFKELSRICHANNIELNCFLMLGMPGDTPEDVEYTMQVCLEHNARVRPTIYTPYHLMHEEMSTHQINVFNRQLFAENLEAKEIENKYYELFFNNGKDRKTTVMEQIEKHSEASTVN